MADISSFVFRTLEVLAALFIFAIGLAVAVLLVLYVIDRTQTTHTIRRNYPVIGRARYFFEHLGEFFRQYFFAMDREELPFNRAERSWAYRAAKNVDNTVAFGSTRDLRPEGTVMFVNCPFPTLDEDAVPPGPVTFGPYCETPYNTSSFFNISGMSYGALSTPAVRALSRGAREAEIWMNTGEGGLSPYHLEGGCDIVLQIGTAKYGVRDEHGQLSDEKLREVAAHDQVRMFELKLSQGAKPGKGGILPGEKVTEEIAEIRGIPAGQDSISPNRHPEIDSVEDLLDMFERIRRVTGKPVGFKSVIGAYGWLEQMCEEVKRRGIESAPDFVNSARGFMFALGCIQALQCNRDTCPTGITTHNRKLQYGLVPEDKAVRVANYARNMMKEVGVIAHSCGVPEPRRLKRFHARVVLGDGFTRPLDEIYPLPPPAATQPS